MKKTLLLLLLATLFALSALAGTAAVHPDDLLQWEDLVVTAGTLRVRQYPGTNTAVVARVHKGDPLLVLGSSGNWFYVHLPDAAGTEGYVYKDYVDAALLDVTFDEAEDVTDCVGGSAVEEDIPEEIPPEHPTVTEETIPFSAVLAAAEGWNEGTAAPPAVLTSAAQLNANEFLSGRTDEEFPEAFSQLAQYGEAFFDDHVLVLFSLASAGGPAKFELRRAARFGRTLNLYYEQSAAEEGAREWLCFVEIPKEEYRGGSIALRCIDPPFPAEEDCVPPDEDLPEEEIPVLYPTGLDFTFDAGPGASRPWRCSLSAEGILLPQGEWLSAAPEDASGTLQTFDFEAVAPGAVRLTFTRPSAKAGEPDEVRSFAVTVEETPHSLKVTCIEDLPGAR